MLLALAVVAPAPADRGPFEPLWALGALLLLGVLLQNVFSRLRLPAIAAWVLAGLILGPSLLGVVEPARVQLLALCVSLTGVWAGLLVGIGASWARARRGWTIPVITCASTLLLFFVVLLGISLLTSLPLTMTLVLSAIATVWGPVLGDFWRNREAQIIGLVGATFALLVLSAVLGAQIPSHGFDWLTRLWLAPVLGAVSGEVLWRIRVLERKGPALLSLTAWTVVAALAAQQFHLPVLPLGLGAGLALAARQGSGRQLEHLLVPGRATIILLFAALLVASTNASSLLWPIPEGLLEIVAVQVVAMVLIRGVGPVLWYSLPPDAEFSRRSGWLLLPRGLVAGDIVLGAGATLPGLLAVHDAALLQAVVLADLLIGCLLFATLAAFVPAPPLPVPIATEIRTESV
ncbi:MAG: hypothetical protein O2782_05520 [bacterium]|nr:hypothetical protein [bacterium]